MRKLLWVVLVAFCTFSAASAEPPASPVQPVPFNPLNLQANAPGLGTASITVPGVASKRVVIYQILASCGTLGLPGVRPTVVVTDLTTSNVPFSRSHSNYSDIELPNIPDKFNPGLTFPTGNSVLVQANIGAACGGGTGLFVYGDQL